MSGSARIALILAAAAVNSSGLSARITPRLADNPSGLSTHGYGARAAAWSTGSCWDIRNFDGTTSPAAAKRVRDSYLLREASTAWGGLNGIRMRSAVNAAM